ncbi:hypothetical protein [Pantoea sp. BAV 3049]|uniref:hypothetical protein n=1 Tax=Pantoea sp. BAV 3049 TaxID=2654188 RepID=UPI00131C109B|nr:hypothetical protein [Pantoea sp. BAV 3049]
MKSISLKSALRTRVKSNDSLINEFKLIFHEDLSNLEFCDIANGNAVENIDGSNAFCLKSSGKLYILVGNALTLVDCILTLRVTMLLTDKTSQLNITINDMNFIACGVYVIGGEVQVGEWYKVDFGFFPNSLDIRASDDDLSDDIPLEISIVGSSNDEVVAYIKTLKIIINPAADIATFIDGNWEKPYTKNESIDFETDAIILTAKHSAGNDWPRAGSSIYCAIAIITRKVSLPAGQPKMPMNSRDPAYSYHSSTMIFK